MENRFEDLRKAIESVVLARKEQGAVIVPSERTGKRAEWIFDFRALMLQPKWLDRYAEIFWEQYADKLPFQVGAMETVGIALVAAIVMKSVERGTPVNGFFIRKSRKRKGLMKQVEGTLTDDPVILVDDLMNSGGTFDKQMKILAELDKKIRSIFALLAFREKEAYAALSERGVNVDALFTLKDFGLSMLSSESAELPTDAFDVIWHYKGPDPSYHLVVQKSAPALDESRVFFGGDDGIFRALKQVNGEVVWEFKVGKHPSGKGILSSPVVHKDTVYFGAYDGNVYALDTATGQKKWVNEDADWIGSSPDLAPDLGMLFIGLEFGFFGKRGGIAAISLKTGETVWAARHKEFTHGSPLYIKEEGLVAIGSNDGVLYCYNTEDGSLRWYYSTGGDLKTTPAYDPKRRLIFCASMDENLYAISAHNGTPIFARSTDAGIYSIPLIVNDMVYVGSLDKTVYAIDMNTWKDRWTFETDGRIFASPTIADGSLWIGSNDGRLYELDPENGKLRDFFQATERIMSKVAHDPKTRRIFVRTVENDIYCLQKKISKAKQ